MIKIKHKQLIYKHLQKTQQFKEHNLFLFNPTSEMAIANGEIAWQPNQILQQFEKDLELLPYLFASNNGFILVDQKPSKSILNSLKHIVDINPKYYLKSEIKTLLDLNNLSLQPWGWSPAAHHTLKPLKNKTSKAFQESINYKWRQTQKDIVSRQFSAQILESIVTQNPLSPYLLKEFAPMSCSKFEEVENQMGKWQKIVLKAPWSSSGRGVQMLRHAELNKSNKQWVSGIIKQQGFIMVEPLLEKLEDFSLQFKITPNEIEYLGLGKFNTNSNGQYLENIIHPDPTFINEVMPIATLVEHIKKTLKALKIQSNYEGYAGFDLMTINYENQTLIHPCVEVNWRYNMGLVALQLQKYVHPSAKGKFSVYFNPKKRFSHFAKEASQKNSIVKKEQKLIKGFIPLSDPEKSLSGAYLLLD